ncbi:MAG TPA: hypothetical protein VIV12_01275 [Streptosporangiaceae bacterium]
MRRLTSLRRIRAGGHTDGVLDDVVLADWCGRSLGARPVRTLFRCGHLAQVVGVALADSRLVVLKIRPFTSRITGCVAVQADLALAGFPCPALLAGPAAVGGYAVTAEVLVEGGSQLPAEHGAAPFAGLLARLIRMAPEPVRVPALAPSPPWAGWDHPGRGCGRTVMTRGATSTTCPVRHRWTMPHAGSASK